MKANCDFYMDMFFALDKNERLSFKLTKHLLFCKNCRSSVRKFSLLEKKCSKENLQKLPSQSKNVKDLMTRLDREYEIYNLQKEQVSLKAWVVIGILLIFSMLVFEPLAFSVFPESMMFPISLIFAFGIITYCVVFVGTNMDFFIKKWKIE